ncbi:UNVERIFIED_CONTAM: hypothetical protein Sradi_6982800 [Sesamum radiatum]|uniref:Transposase MuDR plant domain-containing protein n=1 Tax=Sesamum radiatum TaxID=300843 RepID=A0AAW2JD28_SESRA
MEVFSEGKPEADQLSEAENMTSFQTHNINFNWGGKFVKDPTLRYVGGNMKVFEKIDIDYLGLFELGQMYEQCGGKKSMLRFYYKNPTLPLEWGIRPIKEDCPDICMVDLQNCHRDFDVPVNIYVEEEEAEPLVAIDSQGNPIEKEQEEEIRHLLDGIDFEELDGDGNEIEGDRRKDCEGQGIEGQGLAGDEFERFDCEGQGFELGVDDNLANNEWEYVAENVENFTEIPVQQNESNMTENVTENFTEIPVQQNESNMTENVTENSTEIPVQQEASNMTGNLTENVTDNAAENVTEIPVQNMPDKGKRKLYERFLNESSSEFDDSSDEDYVQSGEGSDSEAPSLVVLKDKKNRNIPETRETESGDHGWASEAENEDDLVSLEGSEGSDTEKHPVYKESSSMKNLNLVVGMKFENAAQFRVVLRDWCIRNGVDLEFIKNEAARVTAKCKVQGCEWRIHASPMLGGPTFQIKTIKGEHTCARTYDNRLANASYIAKRIEKAIRDHPTIPVQQLKKNSLKMQCGFRSCNPGSKLLLRKVENSDPPVFDRMYFSLWALKKGFLEGCRPIIGLDGCFLKTVYGGQLLVAVGRDGNDNMFPIAMAVVQVENRDSWGWFVAIGSKRARLEDYVDDFYTKAVYLKVYTEMIHAVPGANVVVHAEIPQAAARRRRQPAAPKSATQVAARGRMQSPEATQPPTSRSATQQQIGYQGPRNASLLGNNPATSSVPTTRRYNKRPSISEVLDKMKGRQRRQQD